MVRMMTTTMTLRLDEQLKVRLDKLAKATERSRSYVAAEAVREYVELNEWQVKETRDAIDEANKGDFASTEEVENTLRAWGLDAD